MPAPSLLRRAGTAGYSVFVGAFVLVWLAGWTVGTLSADVSCLRRLVRQSVASRYPEAHGWVTQIDRLPRTSSKGHTYYVNRIAYEYQVAGQRYVGHNVRFDNDYVGDAWPAAHPVGTPVTVFYNPTDPSDAGLQPGLTAGDLMLPFVLVIFNGVMLVGWWMAYAATLGGRRARAAATRPAFRVREGRYGVLIADGGDNLMARTGCGWIVTAATAIVAALLVVAFVAGSGWGMLIPMTLLTLLLAWLLRLTRALAPWRRGDRLLVIDPAANVLRLPAPRGAGGRTRDVVPFDRVQAVEVVESSPMPAGRTPPRDSDAMRMTQVTLRWRSTDNRNDDHTPRESAVARFSQPAPAYEMRDWIARTIGLREPNRPTPLTARASSTAHPPNPTDT